MRKRKIKSYNKRLRLACILSLVFIMGTIGLAVFLKTIIKKKPDIKQATQNMKDDTKNRIRDQLLDINRYSRSGMELKKVNGVVIHYTANPGTDAIANRNYFNNLPKSNAKQGTQIYASSNYIIGLEGNIIRCVPETEVAYASNERNYDTLSIECCHPDAGGKFTDETYESLLWLVSTICYHYGLKREDIIRHYDITGKNCPKYFVEHEDKWEEFKNDVMEKSLRS